MTKVRFSVITMCFVGAVLSTCIPIDYTQISRGEGVQGAPDPGSVGPTSQEDRFIQSEIPTADILFIVDNSCSMAGEQGELSVNAPMLMSSLVGSGIDYHVGVITTDVDNDMGNLIGTEDFSWIDLATPDPVGTFSEIAVLGTFGSPNEAGLLSQMMSTDMIVNPENTGFYRVGSDLHVIVVSDEDDISWIYDPELSDVDNYVDFIKGFSTGRFTTFSSIVKTDHLCTEGSTIGSRYMSVTDKIGGIKWSVCEDDWSGFFEALEVYTGGLRDEFFLSQIPDVSTIDVSVEKKINGLKVVYEYESGEDWSYIPVRNSIIFKFRTPEPLETIVIRYNIRS